MPGESLKRSNLIDVTYDELRLKLTGQLEGVSPDQIFRWIDSRKDQLRAVSDPFDRPSDASRRKVESGSVTLPDGVTISVEAAQKPYVTALSTKLQIDEVNALVLLRSFMFNEGLPADRDVEVDAVVEAVTPFFYAEKIALFRCLATLFRLTPEPNDPLHDVAESFTDGLVVDKTKFAMSLLDAYDKTLSAAPPAEAQADPRSTSRWAKQNAKEALALLETLFWVIWAWSPSTGPFVVRTIRTLYDTHLGAEFSSQSQSSLLDDEGVQLLRDSAVLWLLIGIAVLELESLHALDFSAARDDDKYISSPDHLYEIHTAITSHGDSKYAPVFLAWAYVLSRIHAKQADIPDAFRPFFETLMPHGAREPTHVRMAHIALSEDVGLLRNLIDMLESSPVFVVSRAWRTGSHVTDPNALAFRSILKGLVIATTELLHPEQLPSIPTFITLWTTLFSRSESPAVSELTLQYWIHDWPADPRRQALLHMARAEFPVRYSPLVRLLRSLSGAGFAGTDSLATASHDVGAEEGEGEEARNQSSRYVFAFFQALDTFCSVLPASHFAAGTTDPLYVKGTGDENAYTNTRALRLPGGSALPARSKGTLLSDAGDRGVAVMWTHRHSGWQVILAVLREYVGRSSRFVHTRSLRKTQLGTGTKGIVELALSDIGLGLEDEKEMEDAVTVSLGLIRCLLLGAHEGQARELVNELDSGGEDGGDPDLVQLVVAILEDALSRCVPTRQSRLLDLNGGEEGTGNVIKLITTSMSVLAALLDVPACGKKVWLYLRHSGVLFGKDSAGTRDVTGKGIGMFASTALRLEQARGTYPMTLALLRLVQALFDDAFSSYLPSSASGPNSKQMQEVKETVLMRAAGFVHGEVWTPHVGWRYVRVGDKFEMGRRCVRVWERVFEQVSPIQQQQGAFAGLGKAVADAFLYNANMASLAPLVGLIASGHSVFRALFKARKTADARRLVFAIEVYLKFARMVLDVKQLSGSGSGEVCLLEQGLCAQISTALDTDYSRSGGQKKVEPVDVLFSYVSERACGAEVPVEAARLLCSLCASLSATQGQRLFGHMTKPEESVKSVVRMLRNPYEDARLRNVMWRFVRGTVEREPALKGLMVAGRFRELGKGKMKAIGGTGQADEEKEMEKERSVLSIAMDCVKMWEDLWERNPELLACVMRFVAAVWEHDAAPAYLIEDSDFWRDVVGLATRELGPVPEYDTEIILYVDEEKHADQHEAVGMHANRTVSKACAVRVVGMDVALGRGTKEKTESLKAIEGVFEREEQLAELVQETAASSYDPGLHDQFVEVLKTELRGLELEQLRMHEPLAERSLGDGFVFSPAMLRTRLAAFESAMIESSMGDVVSSEVLELADRLLLSVNLNLSLTHSQMELSSALQFLVRELVPALRNQSTIRPAILSISSTIAYDIGVEKRSGDMMSSIHGSRLALLLSLVELAWFSTSETPAEIKAFCDLVQNVHSILLNDAQPPSASILGSVTAPYHQTLLQILYFCSRHCRSLSLRPKALNGEQRLKVTGFIETTLRFTIDALSFVFDAARGRLDLDLDRDMELLVAVFEQCTRIDVNPSSILWLAQCQETDVIRKSLEVFAKIDLVGLSDLSLLQTHKFPLYAPHIFFFHISLTSITSAAERLASDGVLATYSNNQISPAARAGMIDVDLPELPGQRSPAHIAYCSMLSVAAGVVTALGRQNHYYDAEACAFIQIYGPQVSRALSWTINDRVTTAQLEEIEQVVNLFYAIAESAPAFANPSPIVEQVLKLFTSHALLLLQQLNYCITHPNHLASLFEPVTLAEKEALEKANGMDPLKQPQFVKLMHQLYQVTSGIVSTLISISHAESVLLGEEEDWLMAEAIVLPLTKVVMGESASQATLYDLANATLELLRDLVNRPAGQALQTPTSVDALNVRAGILTARKNLECVLLYSVTQLALWLANPDAPASGADLGASVSGKDGDGDAMDGLILTSTRDRKTPRTSLGDRPKRRIPAQLISDLQDLLSKIRPVVAKADEVVSGGKKGVDLSEVLLRFLRERIAAAS